MKVLRVDPERYYTLMKATRNTQDGISKRIGRTHEFVHSLQFEEYDLLSRVASMTDTNPILLVTVEKKTGELVVDKDAVQRAIEAAGMTRKQLAGVLEVHENTMYDLTRYRFPKLNLIAKEMGVSALALLKVEERTS